ncbi:MAG: O-antigen ligase family protein, partial [Patescibacteria group bacterium]
MEWLLLFGLALVITPAGWTEVPKVVVAEVLILGLWLMKIWRGGFISFGKMIPFLILMTFVAVRGGDWGGNGFRLQGVVLTLLGLALGAWAACKQNLNVPRGVVWAGMGMLLASMLFVEANAASRAIGTLGEPNALASVFVFSWPFVGGYAWPAAALVAALSRSRSALIAVLIQSLMWVMAKIFGKNLGWTTILALFALIGSLGLPYLDKSRIWENRTQIWETAFQAGVAKPVFGWGFGRVEEAIHTTAVRLDNTVQYQRVDSSHNIVLDWWIQGGILGLGCWLWGVSRGVY